MWLVFTAFCLSGIAYSALRSLAPYYLYAIKGPSLEQGGFVTSLFVLAYLSGAILGGAISVR